MTSRKHSKCNSQQVKVYECFIDFMEDMVIPVEENNPDHIRLDGKPKGSKGNASPLGAFKHWDRTWKVNKDTYYLPLRLAYNAAIKGIDPFVEGVTNRGGNPKLELICEISKPQREQQQNDINYLNVYQIEI